MACQVDQLSSQEICEAVKNFLGTSDFILREFKIRPASENPLGFLGEHLRISVDASVNGSDQSIQLFAKQIPTKVQSHYEYAQKTRAFYKEIELYKTLLSDIEKAINPKTNIKKWLPKFCYSRGSEIFVVEDLCVDGYYMLPERTVMGLEHMTVAVEAIAIMHAGSFIFEEKLNAGQATTVSPKYVPGKKVTLEDLYDHLFFETEASDEKGHPGNTFWEAGIRSQVSVVDLLPNYTTEEREVVKDKLMGSLRKALQFVKPSQRFKNVLLHGDLWANNLLFRNDSDGSVSDAIILDFQLARYGPPAHDLLMFLYLCQTREFRQKNEKSILDLYYDKLGSVLKAEELDVSKLLPRKIFDESIEYYREYAILNNIMYFQLILTPSEITGKFLASPELFDKNMHEDRSEMIVACYKQDQICNSRMTEAMREAAEFYKWVL